MTKVITQQTFDDVVKENIVEFSMSAEEAKKETIQQFEAQGINLTNIVQDLTINTETGEPVLNEAILYLKNYTEGNLDNPKELLENLTTLDDECKKSIAHRVLAGKNGAHAVLLKLMELSLSQANDEIMMKTLNGMNDLINKQPDIFDAEALTMALKLLELKKGDDMICLILQWLQKACIMHELNRQRIMAAGIVTKLKPLLTKANNGKVLREVVGLFRYLVLDDDVREEFSSAHEHARQIANETLVDITKLLSEFTDTTVLADLLLTVGALAVRQEFCTTVESAGALTLVFNIMTSNPKAARLNREALKFLRVMAGNDTVKAHMVHEGVAPIIKNVLEAHLTNENVVAAALACISTITLRVKDNSVAFFKIGIADIIVEAVRQHPDHKIIQRNAAWTIRNMVSRSREQCDTWLSLGIEDLLKEAALKFPNLEQDVKAALRDLGCDVLLREEWTGTAEKKITNA